MKTMTLLFCLLLLSHTYAIAGHADSNQRATSGTIRCGGNQAIRNGGDEFQYANYVLRNYNTNFDIRIDRMRFLDATGATMFDFTTPLPSFFNGILGGADNILEANQTALLRSFDIFGMINIPKLKRPIQVIINWSSTTNNKVLLLESATVRLARERIVTIDPNTGAQLIKLGAERSRHLYECRTVAKKKR